MLRPLDPLAGPGERFALDQPKFPAPALVESDAPPFALRFATAPVPVDDVEALSEWRLCPDAQLAVTPQGTPWYMTVPKLPMSTTGESSDGGPSTGGEEWRPDYQSDCDGGLA